MEFWNSLLTEKSWNIMQHLKKEKFRFIIIGGWAAYLWTKLHKSKDIDIIIPEITDLEIIKEKYDLRKNDHLKKYEIKFEEIDVDIYIPYYSRLALPVVEISKQTSKVESFEVVLPEILLILKQGAELNRKDSIKGQKDRIDIMTLLCYAKIDFKSYNNIIEQHKLVNYRQRLRQIITTFKDLKHLNTNANDYAKIKRQLLEKL